MKKQPERVAHTKQKIEEAFLTLYADHDIQKISIKSITDLAGVYRSTLYLYYEDIYDLLEKIENQQMELFQSYIEQQAAMKSVGQNLKKLIAYFSDNGGILSLLMQKSYDNHFKNRIVEVIEEMVRKTVGISEPGNLELNLTLSYIANTFVFFLEYCAARELPIDDLYPQITELLHHGVIQSLTKFATQNQSIMNQL